MTRDNLRQFLQKQMTQRFADHLRREWWMVAMIVFGGLFLLIGGPIDCALHVSAAATVDLTAPAGSPIAVNGKTVATVPADGITLNVKPAPATRPADPPDVTFKAPPGMKVVRLTSGIGSVKLASNTCYIPAAFDIGGRAKLTGSGTIVTVPNNLTNVLMKAVDAVSTSKDLDCLRAVADGVKGVTFDDCSFTGGKNNVVWQGVHIENQPTTKDLLFSLCRFIDPLGVAEKTGQNLFVCNVDGFTLDTCFGVNAGFKHAKRDPYTHFLYNAIPSRRVKVVNCFAANPCSIGIMTRGPGNADTTDPGPVVTGNVVYQAPIGYVVNGPKGTFTSNLSVAGPHHTTAGNNLGECMTYSSVGRFTSTDNRIVHGPRPEAGYVLAEGPYRNAKRSDVPFYGGDCSYVLNARNTADLRKIVNLDDLVVKLRAGGNIGAAVAEAKRRAN